MIGVARLGEPAGDREPLEDGVVSEARGTCRESEGVIDVRTGMSDRLAGL